MSPSELAQSARIEAGAYNLTTLAIGLALPIIGIVLGFVTRRKDKGERFRLLPVIVCAGVGFVALANYIREDREALSIADHRAMATSESEINLSSKPVPVGAIMTPTTASRSREVAEALRVYGQDLLAKSGHPGELATVTVFDVSANGRIVTRATSSTDQGVFSERAEGILQGRYVTIICDPKDPPTFEFAGSPCHRKMEQIFGSFGRSAGSLNNG